MREIFCSTRFGHLDPHGIELYSTNGLKWSAMHVEFAAELSPFFSSAFIRIINANFSAGGAKHERYDASERKIQRQRRDPGKDPGDTFSYVDEG